MNFRIFFLLCTLLFQGSWAQTYRYKVTRGGGPCGFDYCLFRQPDYPNSCIPCPSQAGDCVRSTSCTSACAVDIYALFEQNFFCCDCKKPSSSSSSACFPSVSKVYLENGKSVTMAELQIGDKVQTALSGGSVAYSPIKMFMKKQQKAITNYKSITTTMNKTISLTGNHLIYARKYDVENFNLKYADDVSIDAELLVQENNEMVTAKVTHISSFTMQGAYTPVSMEGNIVVDGVLASCYAFPDHDLAHFGMTSFRFFPQLINWLYGDNNGSPVFVEILKHIGEVIFPFSLN